MIKVGNKLATLRKVAGYSQEKLASMLMISPQAISKWENGHTLPETSLLPVLAKFFNCTIDEIIMPGFIFDKKTQRTELTVAEQQAEQIALSVVNKIEKKKREEHPGLSDDEIIDAILKIHHIDDFTIERKKETRKEGFINRKIEIFAPDKKLNLAERIYYRYDARPAEFNGYTLLFGKIKEIPQIYHVDYSKKLLLLDDINDDYFIGDYNEDNEICDIYRKNYKTVLRSVANWHGSFWEDYNLFKKIGICWHHSEPENMLAWIKDAMEKQYKRYRKNEEAGKIPKTGVLDGANIISKKQLDYYEEALLFLKSEYTRLAYERFNAGKNITVIHGDLHPGQTLMSKKADRNIIFRHFQAIRIGLCTEDLAMLIALHISDDSDDSLSRNFNDTQPLLDYYYNCISETAKNYSHETFMNDYKISVAENLFFPIRLINQGIFDFRMRDKAINAFETFVIKG